MICWTCWLPLDAWFPGRDEIQSGRPTSAVFVAEVLYSRSASLSRNWGHRSRRSWQIFLGTPALPTVWLTETKSDYLREKMQMAAVNMPLAVDYLFISLFVFNISAVLRPPSSECLLGDSSIWKDVFKLIHHGRSYKYECKKSTSTVKRTLLISSTSLSNLQRHGISRHSSAWSLCCSSFAHCRAGVRYFVSTPTQRARESQRLPQPSWSQASATHRKLARHSTYRRKLHLSRFGQAVRYARCSYSCLNCYDIDAVLQSILGDLVYLSTMGTSILLVSSFKTAGDLFERRSTNYSDRFQSPMSHDL